MEPNNNRPNPFMHRTASRSVANLPRHASLPNDMSPTAMQEEFRISTHESAAQQVARGMASFGKAHSTERATKSALNTFDEWYRKSFGTPYTSITEQTIENDFLQLLLLKYACYLGRTKIPSKKGGFLTIKVLTNYFGKAKDYLRSNFPTHPAWNGHDNGGWYTTLYKSLEKDAARAMSDEAVRTGTMPLYREACPEYYHVDLRDVLEPGHDSDLIGVCRSLMAECTVGKDSRSEKSMQHRFWIVTDYLAAGRGGEIKFLRWDEARWDNFLQSPVMVWSEVKTLTEHLMMFVPDASGFEFDWMHSLGSYACLEHGLYRPIATDGNIKHFVFPNLHEFKGDSVTRNMTKVLRKYVNPQVQELVSSRSLREACGTVLAMHPDISDAEMRARGGWAAADNSKYYHNDCPSTNLPGAAALAGHDDCHRRFFWPTFSALPWHWKDNLHVFVETLLPTNLPYFQQGGLLYPLRLCAAASLVMHFSSTMQKFGGMHSLNKRLNEVARAARICDDNLDCSEDGQEMDVLKSWSARIRSDFETRNSTNSARNIHETLRLQVVENQAMRREVAAISATLKSLTGSLDKVQTAIAEIYMYTGAGKRRHVTPDGTRALPTSFRAQLLGEDNISDGEDANLNNMHFGLQESTVESPPGLSGHHNNPSVASKKPPPNAPPASGIIDMTQSPPAKKARLSAVAKSSLERLQTSALYQSSLAQLAASSASISIKFLLDELYTRYICGRPFTNVSPSIFPNSVVRMLKYCPGLSSSKKEVQRCMELVQCTVTTSLFEEYFQECISSRAAAEMEQRAVAWVVELEEWAGLRNSDSQKKCKIKPYVVGLGKRLLKILSKKNIKDIPSPRSVESWNPRT